MGYAIYQLPPPANWEIFESLCRDVFSAEWSDPATQKHGRTGYPQYGVDVYGYMPDQRLCGIQCKKKDNHFQSKVSGQEIRNEAAKALNFNPKLSSFIFATTTPNDPDLEEVAREITEEHKVKGLFSVHYFGWGEIHDRIHNHREILARYYSSILDSNDSTEYAFNYWAGFLGSKSILENASYLPFLGHQVKYREQFISQLLSFACQSETLFDRARRPDIDEKLRIAIDNFNAVSRDIVDTVIFDEQYYNPHGDYYTYRVDVGPLNYHEQRDYVAYKKDVLRRLFFNLVKSANHIIDVGYRISPRLNVVADYIQFRGSEGEPFIIPTYEDDDTDAGIFYKGLKSVKDESTAWYEDPVQEYEEVVRRFRVEQRDD
ncbi:hypothetical protein [Paraburkholderia caribensis]|uniref:hypothetical protein n=1 Tax=Paraburkholderia caribensis TaxID=75105 RepID=UPI000AB3EB9A|nr:hypothetical protein [Paraburkholderia caribensis]